MARKKITSFFLYRRRVLLAYIFIFAALIIALTVGIGVQGGLTHTERDSSVTALNDGPLMVNAPYYLLQKSSIMLLGFSTISIKLPSVLIGVFLGVTVFFLLRRWLTLSIATFGALIIFASTTFLSLAGTGSPDILYVLFPALLLFFGTRVLAHDGRLIVFSILLLVTVALALLTPTMIYLVVLAFALAAFNPHVRYGFRRLPVGGLLVLVLGFIIAVAPLAYLVVTDPSTLTQILALPSSFDLGTNVATFFSLFGSFLQPGLAAGRPAPLVGLATVGLAVLGLYQTIRGIYTARAQFIIGWSVIALVLSFVDPDLGILLYLPLVLLAAIGLAQLAGIWYRTFPLNPYARISAFLPIGILIGGIVIGSSLRFINTVQYADGSAELYSHDLSLIQTYVRSLPKTTTVTLVVPGDQQDFYGGLPNSTYTVIASGNTTDAHGIILSASELRSKGTPARILTDSRADESDRFYVYK